MQNYDFKRIEEKWQNKWAENKMFKAIDFHPTKPKYYVLYEFYNISGNLHMGHLKGTVPADALARYKRFCGYNVLFPIGGDAFGLPAENAAIKENIKPENFVKKGMETVLYQSKRIGLSFDWDRVICTSDPSYYKWTQWIFLQLLKNDKAYKSKGMVNFCPKCQTILSNEDSQGGKCDRCGSDVIQKERWVWFLKMKEYSDRLLDNVDRIQMAEYLKEAQRNWIGKSEGMQVTFDLVDEDETSLDKVDIFTTCIETIYGVTFLVLAPEHEVIEKYQDSISNIAEVKAYQQETLKRSEFERIAGEKGKAGVALKGLYAINPMNGKKIPVYIADFVLLSYGTGAVMAVPTHDQRDYDFAKQHNISMVQVIEGDCRGRAVEKLEYLQNNSNLMNSEEFSGLDVTSAKIAISEKAISLGVGKKTINYKMQDWPFNRQRYWGEPFPVVFCENCGCVPLAEEELPIKLPKTTDYLPGIDGDSPLSKIDNWVNCKCPKCGKDARRETDTMPNWAGSSWYWLRYADPKNEEVLADYEKLKYWGSVDCYTGGTEHITRHVLYAFFWQNFLYEIGVVPTRDPFIRKMGSGLILDDQGKKMSKSSTNGVSPLEVIEKYGSDAARLHLHFLGGYEDNTPWTYQGITGITAFLEKVWSLPLILKEGDISNEHIYMINRLIKKISDDLENLRLNTAIAALMSFIKQVKLDGFITKSELKCFLILLNPLAPHITSEMYEIYFSGEITDEKWPAVDEKHLIEDTISLPIQINGKLFKTILVNRGISEKEIVDLIKGAYPNLITNDIRKIIYVKDKIINIVK